MYLWDTMGATEIVFILVIYLLLFGAKGMPSLARSMGSAVRQFRTASDEIQREILRTSDPLKPRPQQPARTPESPESIVTTTQESEEASPSPEA